MDEFEHNKLQILTIIFYMTEKQDDMLIGMDLVKQC